MNDGGFQKALYSASPELSQAIWNELMTPHPEKDVFRNIKDKEDYDIYLKNHFSDYTDDEIYNEYKYQIQENNDDNMGGLIYSAFQVAKCAKIYGDWIMSKQQVRKS